MTNNRLFSSVAPLTVILYCLAASAASAPKSATVSMTDSQGKKVGSVTIRPAGTGVVLELNLKHMPPGEHAIHFHEVAKCDPPDFKSAGPHFNPEKKEHGLQNPKGHHAGDMENFTVTAKGNATQIHITDRDVTLGGGPNSIFANGGTSIVVHAKPDDMHTDPSGNSGDRIACGVVSPHHHWF